MIKLNEPISAQEFRQSLEHLGSRTLTGRIVIDDLRSWCRVIRLNFCGIVEVTNAKLLSARRRTSVGASYTWLKTVTRIPLYDNCNMFIVTDSKDDTRVTSMN